MPSDLALLVALGQGELAALATLYDRYAPAVYGLALALTATDAAAEAVTLTVFLALWHAVRAGRYGEQAPGAWLRLAVWDAVRAHRHPGERLQRDVTAPLASAEWAAPCCTRES